MKNKVSNFLTRATALALFATPFCSISAQEVYSATIGAVAITVPSESDVMVALPFKQEKAAGGTVASVSGAEATLGSSTLAEGLYDVPDGSHSTHYLYVEDGALEGRHFDIRGNGASTIQLSTDELTGLVGASISIRSHWTLGSLFPEGVGYVEEEQAGLRQVEVVLPEVASIGGGLAANRIFYFFDGVWQEVGKPIVENQSSLGANGTIVSPGSAFVVRNNGSDDIDYFFFGEVEYGPLAIPLVSNTDTVDNFVAVGRPLGIKLSELELESSGVFGSEDRLLVYPMDGGKNVSPTIYRYNSGWEVEADGGAFQSVDATQITFSAGQGIAVRKAAAGADATNYWVNEWSL